MENPDYYYFTFFNIYFVVYTKWKFINDNPSQTIYYFSKNERLIGDEFN